MLECSRFFSLHVLLVWFLANRLVVARQCYECSSTFPHSQICLPQCSATFQANSTCLLTRSIPLEQNEQGSILAAHISPQSIVSDATEKTFLFGEEAVYHNPSELVGWDWAYGPITYACDVDSCNDPKNVNRLPRALNARIPNATLDRWLVDGLDSNCYTCSGVCVQDGTSTEDIMKNCELNPCPYHACGFVASRGSLGSACTGGWNFNSNCLLSTEPAQIDMRIMYYPYSNTHVLYQMEAVCRIDNCNNATTFRELAKAITLDPDLSCLFPDIINGSSTSSSSSIPPSTTTGGTAGNIWKQESSLLLLVYLGFFIFGFERL